MKKIKLTIGALLITGVGFTTNPTSQPTKQNLIREITISIEDLKTVDQYVDCENCDEID